MSPRYLVTENGTDTSRIQINNNVVKQSTRLTKATFTIAIENDWQWATNREGRAQQN